MAKKPNSETGSIIARPARLDVGYLVVAVVLDDMREGGVRFTIATAIDDPQISSRVASSTVGRALIERFAGSGKTGEDELDGLTGTAQKGVEAAMTEWLAAHSGLWRARKEARGQLAILQAQATTLTVRLRNFIAQIPSTKSLIPIPTERYRTNHAALEAIFESARQNDIGFIAYIQPRPIEGVFPYDLALYEKFKQEIEDLTAQYGGRYLNAEDAVVGDVWGQIATIGDETKQDIFHFKSVGHAQLADALEPAIRTLIEEGGK